MRIITLLILLLATLFQTANLLAGDKARDKEPAESPLMMFGGEGENPFLEKSKADTTTSRQTVGGREEALQGDSTSNQKGEIENPVEAIVLEHSQEIEKWRANEVRAYATGNKPEGDSWHNVQICLKNVQHFSKKIYEAHAAGNLEKAHELYDVANDYYKPMQPYLKAAQAYAQKKFIEGNTWYAAGRAFFNAAHSHEKWMPAHDAGTLQSLENVTAVIEDYQRASQLFVLAGEAFDEGRRSEAIQWHNGAVSFDKRAHALSEAIDADIGGDLEEAAVARKAAVDLQQIVDLYLQVIKKHQQALEAHSKSNLEEGKIFEKEKADLFVQAIRLRDTTSACAAIQTKIDEQYVTITQYEKNAHAAEQLGDKEAVGRWKRAADALNDSAMQWLYLAQGSLLKAIVAEKPPSLHETAKFLRKKSNAEQMAALSCELLATEIAKGRRDTNYLEKQTEIKKKRAGDLGNEWAKKVSARLETDQELLDSRESSNKKSQGFENDNDFSGKSNAFVQRSQSPEPGDRKNSSDEAPPILIGYSSSSKISKEEKALLARLNEAAEAAWTNAEHENTEAAWDAAYKRLHECNKHSRQQEKYFERKEMVAQIKVAYFQVKDFDEKFFSKKKTTLTINSLSENFYYLLMFVQKAHDHAVTRSQFSPDRVADASGSYDSVSARSDDSVIALALYNVVKSYQKLIHPEDSYNSDDFISIDEHLRNSEESFWKEEFEWALAAKEKVELLLPQKIISDEYENIFGDLATDIDDLQHASKKPILGRKEVYWHASLITEGVIGGLQLTYALLNDLKEHHKEANSKNDIFFGMHAWRAVIEAASSFIKKYDEVVSQLPDLKNVILPFEYRDKLEEMSDSRDFYFGIIELWEAMNKAAAMACEARAEAASWKKNWSSKTYSHIENSDTSREITAFFETETLFEKAIQHSKEGDVSHFLPLSEKYEKGINRTMDAEDAWKAVADYCHSKQRDNNASLVAKNLAEKNLESAQNAQRLWRSSLYWRTAQKLMGEVFAESVRLLLRHPHGLKEEAFQTTWDEAVQKKADITKIAWNEVLHISEEAVEKFSKEPFKSTWEKLVQDAKAEKENWEKAVEELKLSSFRSLDQQENTNRSYFSLEEEWAEKVSPEIQNEIYRLQNNAELSGKRAEEAYCEALSASLLKRHAAWQEVDEKVEQAIQDCEVVIEKCISCWDEAAPELKPCWEKITQLAIEKKLRWQEAWYKTREQFKKERSLGPSSFVQNIFSISSEEKNELKRFPFAERINSREEVDPQTGIRKQIKIFKTLLNYPYIRVFEKRDTAGALLDRKEMVADQLLVTLEESADPNEFLQQIREAVKRPEITMERYLKYSPSSYCLHFSPELDLLPSLLKAAKSSGSLESKPNYLGSLSRLPTDEKFLEGINRTTVFSNRATAPSLIEKFFLNKKQENQSLESSNQWSLHSFLAGIDAPHAWNANTQARNVNVAVLDTGVKHDHDDLKKNMHQAVDTNGNKIPDRYGWNALSGNYNTIDVHGHGTHCAGIIGAEGNNREGIAGIAWNAQLMAYVVADAKDGAVDFSKVPEAIDRALNNGAEILNCSFNCRHSLEIRNALERARNKNVIVVMASGNENKRIPHGSFQHLATYASQFDNIVVVGATTEEDKLATEANWGFHPDYHYPQGSNFNEQYVHLAAPGDQILSLGINNNDEYKKNSGTSMAAPHVTGALALMKSQFPNENYRWYIDRLFASCDRLETLRGKIQDCRRLNLAKAINKDIYWPIIDAWKIANTTIDPIKETFQQAKNFYRNGDCCKTQQACYKTKEKIVEAHAAWMNTRTAFENILNPPHQEVLNCYWNEDYTRSKNINQKLDALLGAFEEQERINVLNASIVTKKGMNSALLDLLRSGLKGLEKLLVISL